MQNEMTNLELETALRKLLENQKRQSNTIDCLNEEVGILQAEVAILEEKLSGSVEAFTHIISEDILHEMARLLFQANTNELH